ncbi:MAG: glycoside hydrolase family 13 protein [Ruminococcaceae bacterium]|nr:glycoside hydrolase family 13 protein [Oscillospiraceae bacterium]
MIKLFDSRDREYRSPFGAVAEGVSVHMRICLPRDLHCSAANLIVLADDTGERQSFNMFWCGTDGTKEWWELDYAAEKAGLYFYWFSITANGREQLIERGDRACGRFTDHVRTSWQLTVYEQDFVTPDWLDGGVMYQIFPDSFCRSEKPHKGVPTDRIMLQWGDQPHWRQDSDGIFRNNRFFGGDIEGIISKLDYLSGLGVTCIYLNPIFESHENHRYSTADYSKIDSMLGDEKDFARLCAEAEKRGMRIILDGVFSHTGCDSVYFNKYRRYPNDGAYNSQQSPYRSWYNFQQWPDKYSSWWGFETLPELHEEDEGVLGYICGDGGIVQRWLQRGASGWRLDVADELPDGFLDALRSAAKASDPQAVIIGEVWEDASNKCAYSHRRRYLLGKQLDSVMNYCFKEAIMAYLVWGDAARAMDIIMSVLENYPPQVVRLLMNLIGTHDTERALTVLAGESAEGHDRNWQSGRQLTDQQRTLAIQRYRLASLMQYTLPGVPSVYYGDEIGLEGYKDPFNRKSYPWECTDETLRDWHRSLAEVRRSLDCFRGADFAPIKAEGGVMAYVRSGEKDTALIAINASAQEQHLALPEGFEASAQSLTLGGSSITESDIRLAPYGAIILSCNCKDDK